MTLHVCQDGDKWYIQEDPESETYIAEFNTQTEAENYVKLLEESDKKKYTISQVFHASSIAREQMAENQIDSDDFNDSEFEATVQEILEYHWDFKTKEKRYEILLTDGSQIYEKIKKMATLQGGESENEIIENIASNSLDDRPLFDELESYLIPETHEAELLEVETK